MQKKALDKKEIIKYELYAILTSIILSTETLNKNKDVVEFLDNLDIEIKPYMQKNRTAMLAKTLRQIDRSDIESINKYKRKLAEIFLEDRTRINKVKSDNYMGDLIDKYSRNKC